eukprot:6520609-Pyramimonas_sp.AAC.1
MGGAAATLKKQPHPCLMWYILRAIMWYGVNLCNLHYILHIRVLIWGSFGLQLRCVYTGVDVHYMRAVLHPLRR